MSMSLVMIAGPHVGKQWSLGQKALSIGRHTNNGIQLKDLSVSRHHCEIRLQDDQWLLCDLDSRSGTFLNRKPIQSQPLILGDIIEVGGSQFRFLSKIEAPKLNPVDLSFQNASTVAINLDKVHYFQKSVPVESVTESQRNAQALRSLLALSEALHQMDNVVALAKVFFKHFFTVIPCERVALVFHEALEMSAEALFAQSDGQTVPFPLNQPFIEQVSRERVGMLCNPDQNASKLNHHPNQEDPPTQALIGVPLHGPYRCLGVLYAATHQSDLLDRRHLELAAAMARITVAPLENAFYMRALSLENQRLRDEDFQHGMIGESAPMQTVYRFIQRVAATDSTVLIRGESGTGKELAARAIFRNSTRRNKPFVAINCAVLSETLLNSELFGHERGAFTGAISRKIGKLEVANGGTLFLDEVGELPPPIQAKFLRVLQEREFERLGGNTTIKVDLRIIAATNRNLESSIEKGEFREDLFYRLNVIEFTMPPLRERGSDLFLLASWFAAKHAKKMNQKAFGISAWAKACIAAYPWPGNVRELANAMERGVVFGEDQLIRVEDLPEQIREKQRLPENASPANYHAALNARKKELIRAAILQSEGNITRAAALLDLHPNYLHRLIRNLGLKQSKA